jgi:hypothetical protein
MESGIVLAPGRVLGMMRLHGKVLEKHVVDLARMPPETHTP